MGRKSIAIVVIAIVLVPVLVVSSMLFFFGKPPSQEKCGNEGADATLSGVSLKSSQLTVKGQPIEDRQAKSAAAIVKVGLANGVPVKGAIVAIMTAIQEATLRNIQYGYPGSSSLGLFQQIAAWGPRSDRLDPEKSAEMFYLGGHGGQRGLTDIPGWEKMPLTQAAQSVQGSGFPEAYAAHEREATKIVNALTSKTAATTQVATVATATETCIENSPIDDAVQAALEYIGEKPSRSVNNGAELVAAAYASAGVTLPKTARGLATYKGDTSTGITATWYSTSQVASGAVTPQPGDIVCYSSVSKPKREDCKTAGMYETGTSSINGLTVATYNVLGSSHTPRSGPRSGVKRIEAVARLIKSNHFSVVGLQELQIGQRNKLVRLLGSGYAIHPETANYGRRGRGTSIESVNSIVVDLSQVEVVSRSRLDMPYYFNGSRKSIPLLRLKHRASGLQFFATNTHDPADVGCRCARYRVIDAERRAEQMETLSHEGIPVVVTGDFNSSYVPKTRGGNITLGGLRSNLATCIITKSGTMVNSWDAFKHQTRTGCSPGARRHPPSNPIDHIFVSRGTEVTKWETISSRIAQSDHHVRWIALGTPGKASTVKSSKSAKSGYYIGLNPKSGRFERLPMVRTGLVGILRLGISQSTSAVASGEWVLPIAAKKYSLSAGFGKSGGLWAADHTGQDFAAPSGTPVRAVTNGTIVLSENTHGWAGNKVEIRHPDGSLTWYCHLSAFGKRSGQVSGGDVIGYVGSTGNSTGPHTHLEYRTPKGKVVDPMPVLREHGLKP